VKLRVTVDQELCIGAGNCERVAPGVFEVDDVARVVDPTAASEEQIRQAEQSCPSGAILVEEEE
jgi:ferredoxin